MKKENQNVTKSKSIMFAAIIIASIGGVILVVSSIISLLINLKVISMEQKLYLLLDGIILSIVVVLFLVAYILYRIYKKNNVKNDNKK